MEKTSIDDDMESLLSILSQTPEDAEDAFVAADEDEDIFPCDVKPLAEALMLDDYSDYEDYLEIALAVLDKRTLAKEMLSFIIQNPMNVRAMRRLLATESLPWSKVHGKYLCKYDLPGELAYGGVSIFEYKHIPFPRLYLKKLFDYRLVVAKCQKHHLESDDEILSKIHKFSPRIDWIADYLLYHSEAMYSKYTVPQIVGFVEKTMVLYIEKIANDIDVPKNIAGLFKSLSLLEWMPIACLGKEFIAQMRAFSDVLAKFDGYDAFGVIAKRSSADGVDLLLENLSGKDKQVTANCLKFVDALARYYTEWSREQVNTLLSVQPLDDEAKSLLQSVASRLLKNEAVILDAEKVVRIEEFLEEPDTVLEESDFGFQKDPSSLYLLEKLHEPFSDTVSARWIESVNSVLRSGFHVALPKEWKLSKEGKREVPPSDLQKSIQAWKTLLEKDFPHFHEVTRFLYGQLLIAAENEYPIPKFPPILLLGEPGIGKTTYVRHMAWHLGIPFAMQSLASVSGGFVLSGTDTTWKAAKPGWIARTFLDTRVANPILLLDEIDKSSSSAGRANYSYSNVQETLLSLLEPETSSRFVDEYLAYLRMDLSLVSFVATANDLSGLSKPLLSRFQVVHIPSPSKEDRQKIVQNIYRTLVKNMGVEHRLSSSIPEAVLDRLTSRTAGEGNLRDVRGLLRGAIGNAMIRAQETGEERISLLCEDVAPPRTSHSMGFL